MQKVAMIGLDGMAWHILNKLFKWHAMPNLGEMVNRSVRGKLESTLPPISATAWTSIATGVNPGKHGIFDFTVPDNTYTGTRVVNSRDVKYLRVHEMVAVQGLRSICINQLLTYPIKKIPNAFVITDWLSPEVKYSPEIGEYAENYQGPTLTKTPPDLGENWNQHYAELSSRVDTINSLLRKEDWDLFWAVHSEPDHLLHRHYDSVVNKDQYIIKIFRKIDETFEIVKNLSDLVIVVSDHGFSLYDYGVYINTFLERKGFVERKSEESLGDVVCHRQIDEESTRAIHIPKHTHFVLSALPPSVGLLLSKIYRKLVKRGFKVELKSYVDPESSTAFAHGFGVYVKDEDLVEKVKEELDELFFLDVWQRDELYSGKHVEKFPDLVVAPKFSDGYSLRSNVIAPKTVVKRQPFSGHHPDGIVIFYKNDLQPSLSDKIRVYDIAPTILDFLGLEIPEDTDGNVIDFQ